MDLIVGSHNSLFGHVARLGDDTDSSRPSAQDLPHFLDGFLTVPGNVLWVTLEASGFIRFALTTTSHMLICGNVLSIEVFLR